MTEKNSTFEYAIYTQSGADAVWSALIDPAVQKRAWPGLWIEGWDKIGLWRMFYPDGRIANSGDVVEIEPARRIELRWRNEAHPEWAVEGYSGVVLTLTPMDGATRISVTHWMDRPRSKLIEA